MPNSFIPLRLPLAVNLRTHQTHHLQTLPHRSHARIPRRLQIQTPTKYPRRRNRIPFRIQGIHAWVFSLLRVRLRLDAIRSPTNMPHITSERCQPTPSQHFITSNHPESRNSHSTCSRAFVISSFVGFFIRFSFPLSQRMSLSSSESMKACFCVLVSWLKFIRPLPDSPPLGGPDASYASRSIYHADFCCIAIRSALPACHT